MRETGFDILCVMNGFDGRAKYARKYNRQDGGDERGEGERGGERMMRPGKKKGGGSGEGKKKLCG